MFGGRTFAANLRSTAPNVFVVRPRLSQTQVSVWRAANFVSIGVILPVVLPKTHGTYLEDRALSQSSKPAARARFCHGRFYPPSASVLTSRVTLRIMARVAGQPWSLIALPLLVACAHRNTPLDLAQVLTLQVSAAPAVIVPGKQIEVTFAVHNSGNVRLSLCSPSGVTTYLQSESPTYVWPIVIHGFTTDTYCSGPFELPPGGEKLFVERGGIRNNLPASSPSLIGKISLSCDPTKRPPCAETQLQTSQKLKVQPAP